jgi:hypothetical protein
MKQDVTDLTPAQEDPVVHGYLSSLQTFSPRAGFEDRVMSRVWQPVPAWLRPLVRRARTVAHPKRAWVLAGGLAFTSSVFVTALVVLVVSNWVHVETAWQLFSGTVLLGTWSVVIHWTAASVAAAVRWFQLLDVGRITLAVACCLATAVMLVSVWGLRRTIKRYDSERVALHAMR